MSSEKQREQDDPVFDLTNVFSTLNTLEVNVAEVKNDINWLKTLYEKLDRRVWYIIVGIMLSILLQILMRLL